MRWIANALVGVMVGVAFGWAPPTEAAPPAVIYACVTKHADLVRIVDATDPCRRPETRITWNVTGPPGPQGPAGPAGPPADRSKLYCNASGGTLDASHLTLTAYCNSKLTRQSELHLPEW